MSIEHNGTNDNSKIPDWVKPNLFEKLLSQQVDGFKCIKDLRASAGVPAGDNYATIMLRVELVIETQDKTTLSKGFMLKIPHKSEMYANMLKKSNIFDTERGMYMNVVPELEQIYQEAGLSVRFGAEAYEIAAPDDYVLLEDLRPRGFKIANRLEGLNLTHTESVLTKLAQWHAASAVRVDTKGPYDKTYCKGWFSLELNDIIKQFCEGNANILLKYIGDYKGHEAYLQDLLHMDKTMMNIIQRMSTPDPDEFNALNHGDCWLNNIMFRYNENGELAETFFVDLQIPKYGSVVQDLLYFLLSSTSLDLKLSKFEYFIWFYHNQLIQHLQLLKYRKSLPTLKSIHQALYKYGAWGLVAVVNIMGLVLLDPTEEANLDNFLENKADTENSFKKTVVTNQRYRKHMELILPWLQHRGALE